MIRQHLRRLTIAVLASVLAFGAAPVSAAGAATPDETVPTITFSGGGFGHGIGMSQYGALGRAEAGHTYQEILAFYYANTGLAQINSGYGPLGADDDVDVLIDIRSSVTVARPEPGSEPPGGWNLQIKSGASVLPTQTEQVTVSYNNAGGWSVMAGGLDLCAAAGCTNNDTITLTVNNGNHVRLQDAGLNLGQPTGGSVPGVFKGGSIILSPGPGGGCGNADQFCVMHGNLSMDQYLYGIAEIPVSWDMDAQKAQAVAARSYAASAIIRRAGNGKAYDVVSSTADQYYIGSQKELVGCGLWCEAVSDTSGQVVVYGSTIAETYYSASNGGHTAEPPDVWQSGSTRPYLVATPDPFDGNDSNPYVRREVVYPLADVSRWLNEYHLSHPEAGDQLQIGTVRAIEVADLPPSGRINFATVRIAGTKKNTVVYRDPTGNPPQPYGERFYNALQKGCKATPGCDALISSNFQLVQVIPFVDVEFDDYFYIPVQWMTMNGLTKGVSPTMFGSNDSNTRAQLATFVWRFAGEPAPGSPHGFDDVVAASYYENAVAWMRENGITTGTSAREFTPDGTVTRAQAAAFLWRFAGSPPSTAELDFDDVAEGTYYTEAVRWMVEWDITKGTTAATYSPDALLTRAQIATFLWRLAGTPDAFADDATLPDAMRVTA